MAISIAVVAFGVLVALALFLFIRREIRLAAEDLFARLRNVHKRYSDPTPTAAAVVTTGVRPAASPAPMPEPALARAAVRVPVITPTSDRANTGLSMPFRPSPAQIEAARVAREKAEIRARWEAAEDEHERERKAALNTAALLAARAGNDSLVPAEPASERESADDATRVFSAGDRATMLGGVAPRDDEPTLMSAGVALECLSLLSPEDRARVDELAAGRGVTREAMMGLVLATGSAPIVANDGRTAGPTTPPAGPANDAPPPNGKGRL